MNDNLKPSVPAPDLLAPPHSVILSGVTIEGRITVKGDKPLVIFGTVHGDVISDGSVKIEATGVVNGVVQARHADIAGLVEASAFDLHIHGLLHVRKTGVVRAATIAYGDLEHERGARVSGALMPIDLSEEERARPATSAVDTAVRVPTSASGTGVQKPGEVRPIQSAVTEVSAPSIPLMRVSLLPPHASPAARPDPATPMKLTGFTADFVDTESSGVGGFRSQMPVSAVPPALSGLSEIDMSTSELRPLRPTAE